MRRRAWVWLAMMLSGGTMFQAVGFTRTGLGGACQAENFFSNGILSSIDMCYLFDCQNGFFGGAVRPCDPTQLNGDLFLDCTTYTGGATAGAGGTSSSQTAGTQSTVPTGTGLPGTLPGGIAVGT